MRNIDATEAAYKNGYAKGYEDGKRHGQWIMRLDKDDCEYIECSLCGEQFYDGDNDTFDHPYNYCPNCGAKMR